MPQEVVTIQVGKTGNNIANAFWKECCEEHQIDLSNGRYVGPQNSVLIDNVGVFFDEGKQGRYVPRTILCDLNITDLWDAPRHGNLKGIFRPEMIVGTDEGSGNSYAKAFHTEGPDVADKVLDLARRDIEKCSCLQGIQFIYSMGGGTGSGLTGLILKALTDYLDKGSKCVVQSLCTVPSPGFSDIVLEIYNTSLALQDALEYSHQVFLFDNAALSSICQKTLNISSPKFSEMNSIVALCATGISSSLRFPGKLNADLRKIHTNLVPFKNAHFLTTGFAPLTAESDEAYRKQTVYDLAQQMISKDNVTLSFDPLNLGNEKDGIYRSRFLASFAAFRGDFSSSEIDEVLYQLQKPGSNYDKFFPDWIPSSISQSISSKSNKKLGDSVTFVSNNTSIHEVFDRFLNKWDKMFNMKSHLHVYEQDGIRAEDMTESRNVVQYISDQYKEFAMWSDKLFENRLEIDGMKKIKESAVLNDEQSKIAQELRSLKDCFIDQLREGRA